MVAHSTAQPFHIIESNPPKRCSINKDSCGVSKKTCSVYNFFIIEAKIEKYATIYQEKLKFGMSQVTTLASRKLWNSWNRSYIPMKMVFLCQYRPSNSPPTSHGIRSFFTESLYVLQQMFSFAPTKTSWEQPLPNSKQQPSSCTHKTTTDNIVNLESDGCFLKVLIALASTWYTTSWIQQIEATLETWKKVGVLSPYPPYPMFTDPKWNNNSSNRQRA